MTVMANVNDEAVMIGERTDDNDDGRILVVEEKATQ
jgi:hypothetical protein